MRRFFQIWLNMGFTLSLVVLFFWGMFKLASDVTPTWFEFIIVYGVSFVLNGCISAIIITIYEKRINE